MEDWQETIQRVVSGESSQVALDLAPISEYITYISEVVGIAYDYKANGFEADYISWWVVGDKKYTLTGDLWYGEHITFQVINKGDW